MADDAPEPLRARSSAPAEEDLKWIAYYQEEQLRTPARLEETAKYLAAIVSVSLTIFIDKRPPNLLPWTQLTLTAAAVLWMGSVMCSFFVLFPWRYRYRADSPADVRRAHASIVRVKMTVLLVAVVLFLAALALGVAAFVLGWNTPGTVPLSTQ